MASRGKQTLTQRIALDGGKDIEKELKALGAVGEAAFNALKKSIDDTTKSGSGFTKFVNDARKQIKLLTDGSAKVGKAWADTGKAARDFGRNVAFITTAVAGATTGFILYVKRAADAADETNKAAQAAGLSITEYGKLKFAFKEGNVDAEAFAVGMKKLNDNIDGALRGVGPGAALFERLGVSVKDANGNLLPTDQILAKIADKFQKLPDGPTKTALAIDLFGKAGAQMIPVLNEGGAAMDALGKKAEKLGLIFTAAEAKVGDEFGDALDETILSIDALGKHMALLFAPSLTEAFQAITELVAENREQIMAFAKTLAEQVAPIIKDFILLLQGKDAEVANKGLLTLRDTVVSIGKAFETLNAVLGFVWEVVENILEPFVALINLVGQFFGVKITTKDVAIFIIVGALTGAFKALGLGIKAVAFTFDFLVSKLGLASAQFIAKIAGMAVGLSVLKTTVERIATALGGMLSGIGEAIGGAVQAVLQAVGQAVDAIVSLFSGGTTSIGQMWDNLIKGITGLWTGLGDSIKGILDSVVGWIKNAWDWAVKLVDKVKESIGLGGGAGGTAPQANAAGGHIRGRGTGTSDSILSWLSNGEFVVRAKAVRKYGVGMLSALNGMRLPKFALGGHVAAPAGHAMPIPAFAGGGPVGRPLSLTIGGDTFEGLIAPETVAGKLVRYATARAVRSAGRRPSWSK